MSTTGDFVDIVMFDLAGVARHPTLVAQECSPDGPNLPAERQSNVSSDSKHYTHVSQLNLEIRIYVIYAEYAHRAYLAHLSRMDEGWTFGSEHPQTRHNEPIADHIDGRAQQLCDTCTGTSRTRCGGIRAPRILAGDRIRHLPWIICGCGSL